MASLITWAYFMLGLGPGLAFFLVFLVPKSFLVLLSFTSTFYWLLVLLITSAIFKGFLPLHYTTASYAGMLVGAVVIQELARCLLYWVHSKTAKVLEFQAQASGTRFEMVDKLYLGLGWGWGHGAAHAIFFYLSFLPLTTTDATWYLDMCPTFSMFLAGAVYSLAFGMLLTSFMVIAWEGYHAQHWLHILYPPVMHLGVALLTLLNMRWAGCLVAMPLLLCLGAANMAYAGQLCWKRGAAAALARRGAADVAAPLVTADMSDAEMQRVGSAGHVARRRQATAAA